MQRVVWGAMLALFVPATASAAESNGRLVFSQDERIATMRGDGSELADLGSGTQPDWSPDGTRIAFVRGGEDSRIWAMAPDGSGLQPLTPRRRSGVSDVSPEWSPDGSRLAFVQARGGDDSFASRLVVRDLNTGRERVLMRTSSKDPTFVIDAAWSPDGGQLAYTRFADPANNELEITIFVMDVATGKSRRLIANAGLPAWSPDGSRIAFTSLNLLADCGQDDVCEDIHVVGADGTGDTAIVTGAGVDEGPAWSPDGGSIVFQSNRNFPDGSNPEIYAVRPDGSCLTWLTNGVAESTMPDWQPGSGGVPDSLGCGAVGRQPAGPDAPRGFGWWAGSIAPGNMMTSARADSALDAQRYFNLIYDDCAAFDSDDCGPQFEVQNDSTCNRNPLEYAPRERTGPFRIVRGTLVFGPGNREGGTDVYVGDTTVTLYVNDTSNVSVLIDALRPLDWARPVGNLPPPRFPRTVLRRINEARRAGSSAALRRRGWSKRQARFMIRLARAVEPLQPLRAADC